MAARDAGGNVQEHDACRRDITGRRDDGVQVIQIGHDAEDL